MYEEIVNAPSEGLLAHISASSEGKSVGLIELRGQDFARLKQTPTGDASTVVDSSLYLNCNLVNCYTWLLQVRHFYADVRLKPCMTTATLLC
jgi:hypothetical protein